jgi:integrase/recombinase XerD
MQQTIDAFLSWLIEEKGSTANTIAAYRNDLGQFLAWLQAHTTVDTWADIAEGDIRAYRDALRRRDYALTTVARKLAAVRSFFHYQLRTSALADDPTVKVTAGAPVHPSPERLSRRAAQQLWDSVPGDRPLDLRDRALIAFIARAGLKASQATALDLEDVAPQAGGGKTLALPPAVAADLARYVAEGRPPLARKEEAAGPRRPLFLNARGGRLSRQGLWVVLKRRGEDAGLGYEVSPRSLRGVLSID